MSKVNAIKLLTDSSAALSNFEPASLPNIAIKPADLNWENQQITDPINAEAREAFSQTVKGNEKASHLVDNPAHNWADFIAHQSVESSATFIFMPDTELFPEQHQALLKAMMVQKTQYADFFEQHNCKTGMIKSFEIKTDNWFSGIGLIMWQCQKLLQTKQPEDQVSLSSLRELFEQLAKRTYTLSIFPTPELKRWGHTNILHDTMLERLGDSLSHEKWIYHKKGHGVSEVTDRGAVHTMIDQVFIELMQIIEAKRLAFNIIVISCTESQLLELKQTLAFEQIDMMQEHFGFRWVHQVPSITAQLLTGKSAFQISYAIKEGN